VNDVPCRQCGYCGEHYFGGQVLRHTEKKFNDIYVRGQQASQEVPIDAPFGRQAKYSFSDWSYSGRSV
jgi:hypothetical protein